MTVSNNFYFSAGLNGILQSVGGVVSASTTSQPVFGGTGTSTAPSYGQVLLGNYNGTYSLVATSSLGILGANAIQMGQTGYMPYYSGALQAVSATSSIYLGTNSMFGIGTVNPTSALSVYSSSSPQAQIGYDGSDYTTLGIGSNGATTLAVNGSQGRPHDHEFPAIFGHWRRWHISRQFSLG